MSQEAKEQSTDLLAKARSQMEEQDDEIKKLSEAILNAKCHAIRDAQLREREEIIRAMKEEEVRKTLSTSQSDYLPCPRVNSNLLSSLCLVSTGHYDGGGQGQESS